MFLRGIITRPFPVAKRSLSQKHPGVPDDPVCLVSCAGGTSEGEKREEDKKVSKDQGTPGSSCRLVCGCGGRLL